MRIVNLAFSSAVRVNDVAPVKFVLATVFLAIVMLGLQCAPSGVHSKPHKTLVRGVFYIGMTADDALARLPAGYTLEPMPIINEHPQGATAAELKLDEYFAIADSQSNLIPLFFNQDKQLVRAAPEFDEEKYVSLYEEKKSKNQAEKGSK
jgi:hypothetical protein